MRISEAQKRLANLRRKRWNREELPYFKECLICHLTCDQLLASKGNGYDLMTCPKRHEGEPFFPYQYKEMKKEYDKQEKERHDKERGKQLP